MNLKKMTWYAIWMFLVICVLNLLIGGWAISIGRTSPGYTQLFTSLLILIWSAVCFIARNSSNPAPLRAHAFALTMFLFFLVFGTYISLKVKPEKMLVQNANGKIVERSFLRPFSDSYLEYPDSITTTCPDMAHTFPSAIVWKTISPASSLYEKYGNPENFSARVQHEFSLAYDESKGVHPEYDHLQRSLDAISLATSRLPGLQPERFVP